MKNTFLEIVIAKTRNRMRELRRNTDSGSLREQGDQARAGRSAHAFRAALSRRDRLNIIAEIKRASPSKGVIRADIDVVELARAYEHGGAAAISVLTESEFFAGSLEDLERVCESVTLPVLRKDFIVDEIQIYEAAIRGADAVLLIVAALAEHELIQLKHLIEEGLGMDALIEVHDADELAVAIRAGASIIGVNNRDLRSLDVSLDVSRSLVGSKPPQTLIISESGLSTGDQLYELHGLGFDGFLIGETLMRTDDPAAALAEWVRPK